MKILLRIAGAILIGVGTIILLAGRSAASDFLGTVILLLMGRCSHHPWCLLLTKDQEQEAVRIKCSGTAKCATHAGT